MTSKIIQHRSSSWYRWIYEILNGRLLHNLRRKLQYFGRRSHDLVRRGLWLNFAMKFNNNNYWNFRSRRHSSQFTSIFYLSHKSVTGISQAPKPRWWGGSRDRVATGIEPATCRAQEKRPVPQNTRPPGSPAIKFKKSKSVQNYCNIIHGYERYEYIIQNDDFLSRHPRPRWWARTRKMRDNRREITREH